MPGLESEDWWVKESLTAANSPHSFSVGSYGLIVLEL